MYAGVTSELPPELKGMTPRTVPPEMWDSPAVTKVRRSGLLAILLGTMMLLASWLPIVSTWSLYVLPLAYLHYIAVIVIVLGAVFLVHLWTSGGPLRYVENGNAAMGIVQEIDLHEQVIEGVSSFIPRVTIALPTQALVNETSQDINRVGDCSVTTLSTPQMSAEKMSKSQLRFGVGDKVPVVWFEGKFDKSKTLYDSLGLHEAGIWTKDESVSPTPFWMSASIIVGGGLLFFSLMWSLWAMGKYTPIANPSWLLIGVCLSVGIVVGAGFGWLLWMNSRSEKRQRAEVLERVLGPEASASPDADGSELVADASWISKLFGSLQGLIVLVALAAGAVMLPSLIFYNLLTTANAVLDTSAAQFEIAELDEMVQVTHSGIFREYKIKYHLPERGQDDKDLSLLSTPSEMQQFEFAMAVAVVHEGWFGWQWVRELKPMELVN